MNFNQALGNNSKSLILSLGYIQYLNECDTVQ